MWKSDNVLFEIDKNELFVALVGDVLDKLNYRHQFLSPELKPLRSDFVVIGRAMYNKNLKDLASACKIDTNLTSYTSRHSWATIAKRKGVPTAIISEGLGHTNEHTTQVYLDSFDKEVMDEYNESIIS